MRIGRRRETECLKQEKMTVGVLHMVVAAHNMRHPLCHVVADIRKVEYRASVAADDDQILDSVQRLRQFAFHKVIVKSFAARKLESGGAFDHFRLDKPFDLSDIGGVQRENHISGGIENIQILESGKPAGILNGFALVVDCRPDQSGA